ncbi:stress-responsive transcription factor hsf1 [Gryganskiella cystojenkinii]|nr:stress-responsive transcription factor hsf1 [Gryganskiella cystojenkinii]
MAMINNSETALALLQANGTRNNNNSQQQQAQGPSTSLPNANNMLVNGTTNSNNSGSNANTAGTSGSLTRASSARNSTSSGAGSPSTLQQLPRPSSNARGNVAAFLTKLYNMVGDEASNNLIKWSDDGHSFIVIKHVEFAKEVLPKFFKHNNFSSFVRQLNMYGFHKVPHLQQGVLQPDADSEQWEFSNPHFQKNQPDLLCLVSRKKASNGSDDKDALTMDLGHILSEVTAIKKHQVAISSDLKNIERDHQVLWQESVAARERHQRQQETIDKILRFLASVFSGEKKRAIVPNKKPRLTITEGDIEEEIEPEHISESDDEHEAEVTELLGSKRKRASMVESEGNYVLPGMDSRGSSGKQKSSFSIGDMTPATLALLADANANASQSMLPKKWAPPASTSATSTTSSTTAPTRALSSATSIPTVSAAQQTSTSFPDYLTSFPSMNFADQTFKLDPSNLPIPTSLLPNVMSPVQQELLRSISRSSAQNSNPAPLPPSFVQTPAGANVVKGVDQITAEMEQLQRSIEALEQHGLNVDDFNFDDDYLNLSSSFDPNGYEGLATISESGIPYHDPVGNEGENMDDMINSDRDLQFITPALGNQHITSGQNTPGTSGSGAVSGSTTPLSSVQAPALSNSATPATTPSVPAASSFGSTATSSSATTPVNPRTSTVGEEYLEDLLDMDPV